MNTERFKNLGRRAAKHKLAAGLTAGALVAVGGVALANEGRLPEPVQKVVSQTEVFNRKGKTIEVKSNRETPVKTDGKNTEIHAPGGASIKRNGRHTEFHGSDGSSLKVGEGSTEIKGSDGSSLKTDGKSVEIRKDRMTLTIRKGTEIEGTFGSPDKMSGMNFDRDFSFSRDKKGDICLKIGDTVILEKGKIKIDGKTLKSEELDQKKLDELEKQFKERMEKEGSKIKKQTQEQMRKKVEEHMKKMQSDLKQKKDSINDLPEKWQKEMKEHLETPEK